MKKSNSEDSNFERKNPFKKLFSKSNKQEELEYTSKERSVRHIEKSIPFLNDVVNPEGEYGQAEDVQSKWGLDKKESTIKSKSKLIIVRAAIALCVLILIAVSVFYVLPRVLPSLFEGSNIELFVEKSVNLEYSSTSFRVVTTPCESVYEDSDVTSERITQVLYNEPVTLLSTDSTTGFIKVTTMDGITGYIRQSSVTDDTSSIEPDLHEYRLVVADNVKNIMTHTSQGTLITKVMMNTVLYADVKRDGVYQVALPNGDTGWIGSSGVVELGTRDSLEALSCRYFVSSALSLVNATYLQNGITMNGLSINGVVYVCSCVNGIQMPRTIQEQAQTGEEVTLEYDVVSGDLIIDSIIPGDIVFLRSPYSDEGDDEIYEMAICTDPGTLLMVSSARTTIRLTSFTAESDICSRIITVRRVFS